MDNSTPNNSELLVRYLDGELSSVEIEELERKLAADFSLQQELEGLQLAKKAVRSYGLSQEVAAIHEEMMVELKTKAPVRKMSKTYRITRWSIAVAASVLLIFIGIQGYNFYRLSPDRLYNEQYSPYELTTTRDSQNLSVIEEAYKEKQFKKVIELKSHSKLPDVKEEFLAGMSYLQLNALPEAMNSFNTVLAIDKSSNQTFYKDEAEYYLALAYLKNRDYDKALDLMKSIHNNPGHLYHEKFSNRFIRKVKMLKWR